jgi:hypothetical protein
MSLCVCFIVCFVVCVSLQEPDAGRIDNRDDPDFGVNPEEMTAADAAAAEEPVTTGD